MAAAAVGVGMFGALVCFTGYWLWMWFIDPILFLSILKMASCLYTCCDDSLNKVFVNLFVDVGKENFHLASALEFRVN